MKNPYTGTVALSFLQTLGISVLPEMIRRFHQRYPLVDIQLHQSNIFTSLQKLLHREIDLCLISSFDPYPEVTWYPLFKEELYLYVPAGHRLAARTQVALSELSKEHFIGFKEGLGMRKLINGFCGQAGFTPLVTFEGEDVSTLAGLVSAGLGVTLIPSFHGVSSDKIKKIPISEPYCYREIGLAWLHGNPLSPSAELFRSYVIEENLTPGND
nr:LysR substrate-binding domain-containing protein [Paenibacillus dendrobii]